MAAPSSQFQSVWAGDENDTLTELSQYVRSASLPRTNSPINTTTFAAGGGAVTTGQLKGAIQSQPQVEFLFSPDIVSFLARIAGSRNGSTWQFRHGNNAAPQPGDQMWTGTYTVFGVTVNYNAGQDATVQVDLRPTDGGSIIPQWASV
jgi:hypothetical protein